MRAALLGKAQALVADRMRATRWLRNTLVGLSVAAMAVGGATSAASRSTAASASDAAPIGSATVNDYDRDLNPSRADQRGDVTPEMLAAQRTESLRTAADDLAAAQRKVALTDRQDGLENAALQISAESRYLKERSVFLRPTAGKLGSPYGMRLHPILHYWRMHDGMDIGGNCGQPIVAAADGVVVKAATGGYNGGSGNNVRVDSGDINGVQVEEAYLHMQSIVVKVGQQVVKGDLLGYVGSTGLSTACHLHFSVYENGKGTNPAKYLKL